MSGAGGVSDFVSMMAKNSSEDVEFVNLSIGQPSWDKSRVTKVCYPFFDNVKLLIKILREDFDAVQLNPSLVSRATLRDALFMATLGALRFWKTIVFFHGWDIRLETKIKKSPIFRSLFKWTFGRAAVILNLAKSL